MKKLTIGLSLLLLLVAVPLSISRLKKRVEYQGSATSFDTASLSFSPTSRSMTPNQEGTLNVVTAIDATGTVQSGGIQLVIEYDASRIQIVDQDSTQDGIQIETSNLYGLTITNQVNESLGRIFFMAGALDSGLQPKPVKTGGVVATIHFRTKSLAGRADFNFKFSGVGAMPCDAYRCTGAGCDQCDCDVFLYQSENEDILGGVTNGFVEVAYPATSTPTATDSPTPTIILPTNTPTPGLGLTGDVNGDGEVNLEDAILVLENLSAPPTDSRVDINKDGKANMLDLAFVIRDWGAFY